MRYWLIATLLLLLNACDSSNEPACEPTCGPAVCGDDGCGGSCGSCQADQNCVSGLCLAPGCGDGILGDDETCDDSAGEPCTPPSFCESGSSCFIAIYSGSVETCDAVCTTDLIEECVDDDGCCPPACNPGNDSDCRPANCGNGTLDPGETCDPPEIPCPESCPNDNPCLTVTLTGIAQACNAACTAVPITACYSLMTDGCCPDGCETNEDADCAIAACGNGVLDVGEMCDPGLTWPDAGACSPDCNDNRACTQNSIAGAAETCSVMCSNVSITVCQSGDGCCPAGCTEAEDADCASVVCGDGVVDGDEACDNAIAAGFPGFCPTLESQCDDQDPCTTDTLVGDASDCSARCVNEPFACGGGDACCPFTCTTENDAECAALNLCNSYCDKAMLYCTEGNELYESSQACQLACAGMVVGRSSDIVGNTLYCRIHHLDEAIIDPDTHCPHAAETPTEGCL